MKYVYPIILTPAAEGGYTVDVPDLHIDTEGETVAECIDMARDAIGLWGICREDLGGEIPAHAEGDIVVTVDIDFDAYRRANDMRSVRRNVTIPNYLNELGMKAGLNFSQILQEGLKKRLALDT